MYEVLLKLGIRYRKVKFDCIWTNGN